MKRRFLIILATVMGTVLFFSSSSPAQNAPYVIGCVLELTGRQSNLGIAAKRGMDISVEAINAAGGVNGRLLKVVYYDGESEAAKGVIHAKRLIEVDKVAVLAGFISSATAMASIQTVESGKTMMISAAPVDKLWIPTKKWVFNTTPRQREASIPLLLEVLQQMGAKKIAYLYIDTAYGQAGKETFDWAVKEMKITPAVVEKYAPGATDAGPQITHLKAAGADGLLITGNVPDTAMIIKNARDMGFNQPIVSDYAVVSPEFINLAGQYGEGIVTTSLKTLVAPDLPSDDIQKSVSMELYKQYIEKYGPFSLYAGHTWDQTHMIVEALKKIDPNLDPAKQEDLVRIREQLRDQYEKIQGFVGQNGVFNYSPENHNGLGPKCYVPVVIEKGEWRLYKE